MTQAVALIQQLHAQLCAGLSYPQTQQQQHAQEHCLAQQQQRLPAAATDASSCSAQLGPADMALGVARATSMTCSTGTAGSAASASCCHHDGSAHAHDGDQADAAMERWAHQPQPAPPTHQAPPRGRRSSSPSGGAAALHHLLGTHTMKRCGDRSGRADGQAAQAARQLLLSDLLLGAGSSSSSSSTTRLQGQASPATPCSVDAVRSGSPEQGCSWPHAAADAPGACPQQQQQQQLKALLHALQGSHVGDSAKQLAAALLLKMRAQEQQQQQQQQQPRLHIAGPGTQAAVGAGAARAASAGCAAGVTCDSRAQLAAALEVKGLLDAVGAAISPACADQLRSKVVEEVQAAARAAQGAGRQFDLVAALQGVLPKLRTAVAAASQLQEKVAAIGAQGTHAAGGGGGAATIVAAAVAVPAACLRLPAAPVREAGCSSDPGCISTMALLEAALTAAAADAHSGPVQQQQKQQQQQQEVLPSLFAAPAPGCVPHGQQYGRQQGAAPHPVQAPAAPRAAMFDAGSCSTPAWLREQQLVGVPGTAADLECLLLHELEAAMHATPGV